MHSASTKQEQQVHEEVYYMKEAQLAGSSRPSHCGTGKTPCTSLSCKCNTGLKCIKMHSWHLLQTKLSVTSSYLTFHFTRHRCYVNTNCGCTHRDTSTQTGVHTDMSTKTGVHTDMSTQTGAHRDQQCCQLLVADSSGFTSCLSGITDINRAL